MPVVTNFSDLNLTKEYTYADYLLWQFSERVELIRGFIRKMSPAPNRYHQVVARNITEIFLNLFTKHSCNVYFAPFDVRLPIKSKKKDTTVVQPDYLCGLRQKQIGRCQLQWSSRIDDRNFIPQQPQARFRPQIQIV